MAEQRPDDSRVETLTAAVLAVHGEHIPAARQERLRASVHRLRAAAAALATVPLTNADEPDPIFRVYRGEQ